MRAFGVTKENMMAHELATKLEEKGYVHVVCDNAVLMGYMGIETIIEAIDGIYVIKIGKKIIKRKSLQSAVNIITDTFNKWKGYYYA